MQKIALLCIAFVGAKGEQAAEQVSIFKVDWPNKGFCGQENNVTKSSLNPHYFFPVHLGGFKEGHCSEIGYTKYFNTTYVHQWNHNLTFDLYEATQTKTIDMEFKDADRPKRTLKIKFCMPKGGKQVPLYIFGHGAGCAPDDYQYFCQIMATAMIYQSSPPGPIFPADFDSADQAIDAKVLAKLLPYESQTNKDSPLYQKLNGKVIMGGHSMGGGMTVLSVGLNEATVDGIALFAPGLYTKPSGTPFLHNITAPALIVSGSMDCGTNALDKQAYPAFNGLASERKVLLVLKGANHCQWIEPFEKFAGVCKTFEANECHNIPREKQHELGSQMVKAFSQALKSEDDWDDFESFLAVGESAGMWTYVSSKTSPLSKTLKNECPCSSQGSSVLVV